jgi:anti-sigma factor RsiW
MSHLGQRLSALIDGELDLAEREHVLVHVSRCRSCQDEIAALRMLKQRMNALGDAAANAGLTRRLMGLREFADDGQDAVWPSPHRWPPQHEAAPARGKPQARTGRYVLGGSLAVLIAGLGTAAFIIGGEPQAHAPEPTITPSVDVYTLQHYLDTGWSPAGQQPRSATDERFPPPQP